MSLRRRGMVLLLAAFVLRALHRQFLISLAEPDIVRSGLVESVDAWFRVGIPTAMDVLSLAAIVAGALLLTVPFILAHVHGPTSTEGELIDT